MKKIPIGTLVKGSDDPASMIRALSTYGFECFSIMFWQTFGEADLGRMASEVLEAIHETNTKISSLSLYGNVLDTSEIGKRSLEDLRTLIERASWFEASVVGCFAGRVPGTSVPASMDTWKKVFSPLVERAELLHVKIALENCRLGDTWKRGSWNIAINPDAWELLFNAIPSSHIGLEWEPCHQIEMFCEPENQLRQWAPRILHIHGKDSRVNQALLTNRGLYGAQRWNESCFPGQGEFNWAKGFQILRDIGYEGTVDIEGWNDKNYNKEREILGQVEALCYLQQARDGYQNRAGGDR